VGNKYRWAEKEKEKERVERKRREWRNRMALAVLSLSSRPTPDSPVCTRHDPQQQQHQQPSYNHLLQPGQATSYISIVSSYKQQSMAWPAESG
jgi:hypothetical protein